MLQPQLPSLFGPYAIKFRPHEAIQELKIEEDYEF